MELGQLLKQARLEAGLSQRQLCGDTITRNMLSQIENGAARPSMDTLRYLAGKLNRPVSYFLQEDSVSPNQGRIAHARQAYLSGRFSEVLEILSGFEEPDPVFDPERYLLETLTRLSLAEQALEDARVPYCLSLLRLAEDSLNKTPYCTRELTRRNLLLRAKADPQAAPGLLDRLYDDGEWCLRARCALETGDAAAAAFLLDKLPRQEDPQWRLLRGDCAFALGDYTGAISFYSGVEDLALSRLEQCYEKLGDYKMAYHYAIRQRQSADQP